jgi:hypothetical protein
MSSLYDDLMHDHSMKLDYHVDHTPLLASAFSEGVRSTRMARHRCGGRISNGVTGFSRVSRSLEALRNCSTCFGC